MLPPTLGGVQLPGVKQSWSSINSGSETSLVFSGALIPERLWLEAQPVRQCTRSQNRASEFRAPLTMSSCTGACVKV